MMSIDDHDDAIVALDSAADAPAPPPASPVETAPRETTFTGRPPPGFAEARNGSGRDRRRRGAPEPRRATPDDESPLQEIPLEHIDPHALEVTRRLRRFGYRAYLVGGCVRDLLLGLKPKDFDVATSAKPEEVKALFRNSRIIGRRFRLVHVYFRGGQIIETSTFRANASAPEEEGEAEPQDLLIRRDNVFGTEEEDALRRDFTCNGLFYDIGKGQIIDHVGGLADVEARMLRMIGDPDIRLREDPIRILRAIRIAAKANLTIDPALVAAMARHQAEISRCAPARVLEETLRLLRIGHAQNTVRMMDETGILECLIPEMAVYLESPRLTAVETAGGETEWREDEPDARTVLYRHLAALDQMIARQGLDRVTSTGGPVADAVVLGAFMYAPIVDVQLEAQLDARDKVRATTELLQIFGTRLALTRRLSEHLRQIFVAQRHFGPQARRKKVGPSVARKPAFGDALALYEIHAQAMGLPLDEVERWKEQAPAASREGRDDRGDFSDGGPRRRRRRSRRRGRGPVAEA